MTDTPQGTSSRQFLGPVILAVLSAATWFGWLGWDNTYQTDAATGVVSGPYEAWQVIGCVVTLLVIGIVASLRLTPLVVALSMAIGFAVAWFVTAMSTDETGTSGVGAIMVFVGVFAAALVVSAIVQAVTKRGTTDTGQHVATS